MLPKYTFALGGTDAIKKVIEFITSAQSTLDGLKKKVEKAQEHIL